MEKFEKPESVQITIRDRRKVIGSKSMTVYVSFENVKKMIERLFRKEFK
jgi:hypothetical protein